MAEQCDYCGRFMELVDYGIEFGSEWVCSRQIYHIAADPEHWSVNSLDTAVKVAKIRAGLDPEQTYPPAQFHEHLDEQWRRPFWERQVDRVVEMEAPVASDETRVPNLDEVRHLYAVALGARDSDYMPRSRAFDRMLAWVRAEAAAEAVAEVAVAMPPTLPIAGGGTVIDYGGAFKAWVYQCADELREKAGQ